MFKPLPQETKGTITEAASRIATLLTIDAVLYAEINAVLGTGDWTYLHIQSGGKVEVVKVTAKVAPSSIRVVRGQEGTWREAILKGTRTYYARTLSSIYDEVRAQVQPVVLTASGQAQVQPIYAPVVDIESDAHFEVTGNTSNEITESNYSPCKPHECTTQPPLTPFYFTSKLYPIEVSEALTSARAFPKTGKWLPLIYPPIDIISSVLAFPLTSVLRPILREYHWGPEDITSVRVFPLPSTLRQILRTYEWQVESISSIRVFPMSSTLKRILIEYENWPVESITSARAMPLPSTLVKIL